MTVSFLRPAILAALTLAGLSACGGKADYQIAGTVSGLAYPGLVLTDTISGASITINDITQTTFTFPNSIEYGTEYNVIVPTTPSGQPPHQTCAADPRTNADSAGRRASISIAVTCAVNQYTIGGTVSMAANTAGSFAGLKLINGSNDLKPIEIVAPTAPAVTATYAYAGIPYNTPYGITIFAQPTDAKVICALKTATATSTVGEKVSGTVGDGNVLIDVICSAAPPK
jgi:hypothetical protein